MRIAVLAFAAALAFAAPAHAQFGARPGWGMSATPNDSVMGSGGADWERCRNPDRTYSLEVSVESCNRILTERAGRLSDGAVYWQRAMRYLDAGKKPEADADLQLAANEFGVWIENNPRRSTGYNNRAAVLTRLERYDEALADYDHAIAIDSDATSPLLGRGGILFRRGDYAGASEAFERAARIAARVNATGSRHHSSRCEVSAAAQTNLDRGRELCDRGVRNAENPSYARTARGFFHFMAGELDAANADFTRAIEEDEYNPSAVYGRGVVAVRQGRTAEGEADMARGMAMDAFEVQYYANAGLKP